jgi:F-type H+-transporting ATPase subunit b
MIRMTEMMKKSAERRAGWLLALALAALLMVGPLRVAAMGQAQAAGSSSQISDSNSAGNNKDAEAVGAKTGKPAEASKPGHESVGKELAAETRAAEGEEEENAKLKHSAMVQKLGKLVGLDVHQAHMAALWLNFAIIAAVIVWAARKGLPGIFKARGESIRKALEEARAASEDAGNRLAEIESRLSQMSAEIAKMQSSAEKEAEDEEGRIKKAAEEELRKVVQSAEQEIAAAAKQVRRELSAHTADLALALARKQINIDANTDQVLVRNFAANLTAERGAAPTQRDDGKDGR